MAKYSVYKVKDSKVDDLISHLTSGKDYRLINSLTSDNYTLRVYFSGPEDADMWWLDQYGQDFFGENISKRNKIFSGAIIATKGASGYILPFGKTHFYIQEFIVFNFGLDLAEKIANPNQAKMKSLKRFGGKTSKSLVSYNVSSSLDFSSGDSAEYLKLKPENIEDWGKSFIHFGTSVQFGGSDIEAEDLGILLNRIDSAERTRKKFSIPLMRPVKDDAQQIALYKQLGEKIAAHDGNIDFVDYEIYGTDFVFSQQTHVQLKYKSISSDILADLSTTDIASFAQQNGIDLKSELAQIRVKIIVDGQSKYTTQLINLIEYHSDDQIFLYRGKWFAFNLSFIEHLHKSLENIKPSRFPDSFSEAEFIKWRTERTDGIKYRERFVIEKIQTTHGYEVYDREMEYIPYGRKKYQLEVGDIYDSQHEKMFVVKIGSPRDFGYAFDQAMLMLHNTQGNKFKVGAETEVTIRTVTILLLFQSERVLEKVTDTKSMIFELKLDELRKLAIEKGVNLEVQYTTII
jgi:uncharacterized protein (TIGR04141 family)